MQPSKKKSNPKTLLSIAGYDPTSGAGVILDISVFQLLGFHGAGILTSLTIQNTSHIQDIIPSPENLLSRQYLFLKKDLVFSGIKVGMIGTSNNISILEEILQDNSSIPLIVDPVFQSSSGTWLLEKNSIPLFTERIASKASLLTPNLKEAALISGLEVKTISGMKKAAACIHDKTGVPCFIKGGHLEKTATDILFEGTHFYTFEKTKTKKNVHGTGCFLSSALLGYLAKGYSFKDSCQRAVDLTYQAIQNASRIGHGQDVILPFLLSRELL